MILVRGGGAIFAAVQVLVYRTEPYPPGVLEAGLALAGALAVANVAIWIAHRRTRTVRGARTLSVTALSVDVLLVSGVVWLYAFDPVSALWAVLYILPLEGAIRFGLAGAMWTWAGTAVLYAAREVWASGTFADRPLEIESITFRMGIGFLVALVAGLMARNLTRERERVHEAFRDLTRIDELRARLVATLAHDVRNPLTTIRGTLKTVLRHADRVDPSTLRELLETADRQAGRLERLATDLLDLARMEQGRLELHLEDVPLADAVTRGLSYADQEGRFESRVPEDLAVRADYARLEQIVVNLAANALRYGGPPFVVEATREDGEVHVLFRDQGDGVTDEERDVLFEPFRTDRAKTSVGLGLAIVRALTEAQGGTVTYEPNRPRGACFRVSLPAAGAGP